jgi:coronin-1B/1C/6
VPSDFTVLEKDAPDIDPVSKLSGHSRYFAVITLAETLRKVGNVTFHPCADNVLASTSGDHTLKMWDIVKSSNQLTLKHPDMIQSLAFNREGNLLVTTGRDKRIRIWDPRTNQVAQEAPGHACAKNSRAVYINSDRIATVGFGKMSDRQLALWDVKNLSEPIGGFTMLDQSAGVLMVRPTPDPSFSPS